MPGKTPATTVTATSSADAAVNFSRYWDSVGVDSVPISRLIERLIREPASVTELVQTSGLPRRTVEHVLRLVEGDLVSHGDKVTISGHATASYARFCPVAHPPGCTPTDSLVEEVRNAIAGAPAPRRALDHVPATAKTIARRALYLDRAFDLRGRSVLFVGDHDLTSIALSMVAHVKVLVTDIDDSLLAFIRSVASKHQLPVETRFSDFRFGLAPSLLGRADLAFTDPPYTPEGVGLFLTRALDGMRAIHAARVVMCYGHGEAPTLGLKVQRAIVNMDLVIEAMLPEFNRYDGAEAIGMSSDLYVIRPTSATRRAHRDRRLPRINLYTHGAQSIEAQGSHLTDEDVVQIRKAVDSSGPVCVVGDPTRSYVDATHLPWHVFFSFNPAHARQVPSKGLVIIDLQFDPGPLLPRALLLNRAPVVAIVLQHRQLLHEDLPAVLELLASRYEVSVRRNWPRSDATMIIATTRTVMDDLATGAKGALLSRAHAKVGNAARTALIDASKRVLGVTITKKQAREIFADEAGERFGDAYVGELPIDQLHDLLEELATASEQVKAHHCSS